MFASSIQKSGRLVSISWNRSQQGFVTGKIHQSNQLLEQQQKFMIRKLSDSSSKETAKIVTEESSTKAKKDWWQQQQLMIRKLWDPSSITEESSTQAKKGWWHSAELWGGLGAIAGWGMSGAAIYDAYNQGPEVISFSMTPVLIVYSTLFARWAWIVKPQNLLLCNCHLTNVAAQLNQLRRALEHKMENGQEKEVYEMGQKAMIGGAVLGGSVVVGPTVRSYLSNANLGVLTQIAAADAGPFTLHFWAPMSKWLISGASFFDLQRPTDKISLAQYTALTFTGLFFSRYALLVTPINYTLCSVNIALFGSSAWHLGRKINADYIQNGTDEKK